MNAERGPAVISGRLVLDDAILPGHVHIEAGRIAAVEPDPLPDPDPDPDPYDPPPVGTITVPPPYGPYHGPQRG